MSTDHDATSSGRPPGTTADLRGLPGRAAVLPGAALVVTLVVWAAAFVAIRVALPEFGVAGLTVARLLVAALALAVAAPLLGVRRPARADLPRLLVCAAAGMTGYQLLLNAGERTVPAGTASLLVNTGPIFVALLAAALLGERLHRRALVGIALGFTGATLMALSGGDGLALSTDALLVLGAAAAQALFFVVQKPLLARYGAVEVTSYVTWAGFVLALPAAGTLPAALSGADPRALLAVGFLGVAASALGFVTWSYALARYPVTVTANSLYLVPLLAIGIGWLILDETPTPLALLGGAIAVTGVLASRRR